MRERKPYVPLAENGKSYYRFKHVPTGLYWCKTKKVYKGTQEIYTNLNHRGNVLHGPPNWALLTRYHHPDDQISIRIAIPMRVTRPGEWTVEPHYPVRYNLKKNQK